MLCFVFAALIVLLDQFFKRWIVRSLDLFESMDLIPGVIELTYIQNTGAAFGILAGQRWLLAGIAFIAAVILVFILLRYTDGFWGTLGLAAVLGGAVGNLIDRVIYGYVIDMFSVLFFNFAIFNIADIFITLGFITFLVHFISSSSRSAKEEKEAFESAKIDLDDEHDDYYNIADEQSEIGFDDYDDEFSGSADSQSSQYSNPVDEFVSGIDDSIFNQQDNYEQDVKVSDHPTYGEPQMQNIAVEDSVSPASWQEYYEPIQEDRSSSNDALNALESGLKSLEEYDVDAILREYGFEDDKS